MRKSPGDEFVDKCLEQVVARSGKGRISVVVSSPSQLPTRWSCQFADGGDFLLERSVSSSTFPTSSTFPSTNSLFSTELSRLQPKIPDDLFQLGHRYDSYYREGSESLISPVTKVWSSPAHSHVSEILANWPGKYLEKVITILRRDGPEYVVFLNRFLKMLLVHYQLDQCGFYYTPDKDRSRVEMKTLGEKLIPGSFLLRNSSSADCLFAISFKTASGVMKSTRIFYDNGKYYFDCSPEQAKLARRFVSPLHLLQHYKIITDPKPGDMESMNTSLLQLERGNVSRNTQSNINDESPMTRPAPSKREGPYGELVLLKKPLKLRPDSLQHLARLVINRFLQGRTFENLQLSTNLKDYLWQYEYYI